MRIRRYVIWIPCVLAAGFAAREFMMMRSPPPPPYPTGEDVLQARASQLEVENAVLRQQIQDVFEQKRQEDENRTNMRMREDAAVAAEALSPDLPSDGARPSHPGARPRRHPSISVEPRHQSTNLPPPPIDLSLPKGSPFQPKRTRPDA